LSTILFDVFIPTPPQTSKKKSLYIDISNCKFMSISAMVSVSSASNAIPGVISITSVTGLAIGGGVATLLLIILLSSKEIISASSHWNNKISNSFNSVILPLLLVFAAIVVFNVLE
jgi:hypothetical protein